MKDYSKIKEYVYGKHYYNENDECHRLTGPAIEWKNGNKDYFINNIWYMEFYKNPNNLYIYKGILKLIPEYEEYIKQNIKDLIQEYNSKIELWDFKKEETNQLPNWLKDLIIL